MKAPDKIYVVNILDDPLPNNTRGIWSCVEVEGLMNIGYIRKDLVDEKFKTAEETIQLAEDHAYFAGKEKLREAILEMLDEAITHLSDGSLASYYESLAYQDTKEKIQSL